MIDTTEERSWESNNTFPNTTLQNKPRMKFIKLKVVMTTPLYEEEEEYEQELEKLKGLGIQEKPDLPDSLKPVICDRYFNTSYFEIVSWSSIWDEKFECEMIITQVYYSQLRITETINAIYTKKQWVEILNKLGYECDYD